MVLAHGANARVARLITEDEITKAQRFWVIGHFTKGRLPVRLLLKRWTVGIPVPGWMRRRIPEWVQCPWCAGWWTAWPVTAAAWFPVMGTSWWGLYLLAAWSVAHAAGRLNHGSR